MGSLALFRLRPAFLVGLLVGACGGAAVLPPSAPSPLLSKELPAFHRPTIDGRGFDTVLLRGKPVVVKFFAQYCEPCKKTLPAAERLHRDNPDVTFVGIDVDDYSTTAMKMTSAYGLTFPVIHDTGQVLKGRFRVADLPVTFVADRQGVVRWIGGPGQTERDLEQALGAVSAQ